MSGTGERRRARLGEDAVPILAILGLLGHDHLILLSHFYGFVYAFHDLGLITDWFTNGLWVGRPFWITDLALNHLSVHLSPTIVLLTPFYLFSSSSYLLVMLGIAAAGAALYLAHRIVMEATPGVPLAARVALSLAIVMLAGTNRYWNSVLDSAHIEVHYIPLALGFFLALLYTERRFLPIALFALALGVREDAGLYMAAQCVGLALVAPMLVPRRRSVRRDFLISAAIALVWVLFVVEILNPLLFGIRDNHVERGWAEWGHSWAEVLLNVATSPRRLAGVLSTSALLPLQKSLAFLPWLHPVLGALVNVPAVLLYAGGQSHRVLLAWYNSSFLWPGLVVSCLVPLAWLLRRSRQGGIAGRLATAAVSAAVVASGVASVSQYRAIADDPRGFTVRDGSVGCADAALIRRWVSGVHGIPSVATDFRHVVFVPNRSRRFLLRHYESAEMVFLFRDADPFLSGTASAEQLWRMLERDPRYVLREETDRIRVYTRPAGP